MKIFKTYKFRLYPNSKQELEINKIMGCTRLVYNYMLAKKKESRNLNKEELLHQLPSLYSKYPFLKEIDEMVLKNTINDLCLNFNRYYRKLGGFPKFKQKGGKSSFRLNQVYENIRLDLSHKIVILPKLDVVKIRGYRNLKELQGRIINATIQKIANKYYIALLVEENIILPLKKFERKIGIDIGVSNIVVTSNTEYFGNPRFLKKYEKRIKILQKSLARKIKGSKNYYKTKVKLQEIYRKLKNARKKLAEEIVSKIVKNNDVIIAEKLKVKTMLENKQHSKYLRREIANVMFSEILKKLEYKCKWLNKTFCQVDVYYASSQICSNCGCINKEMKDLSRRVYKCASCGLEKNRDLNASINILNEGVKKLFKENVLFKIN